MQINIEKRYAVMIFIGLVLLAGSWVVYAVDTGQGWHAWSQIEKPIIGNDCSGADKAIKTIDLETGAVTCEADDAGGGDWSSLTGKPAGFADGVDDDENHITEIIYYVGFDNNGHEGNDCWLDGGAGSGTGWGGNPYGAGSNAGKEWCAQQSVAKKESASNTKLTYVSYSDTGSASGILDGSSDKLMVVVQADRLPAF